MRLPLRSLTMDVPIIHKSLSRTSSSDSSSSSCYAKELTYADFGKITKDVWTKAEEHVVKIEKEYCKEN
jgi:hypothetical protein